MTVNKFDSHSILKGAADASWQDSQKKLHGRRAPDDWPTEMYYDPTDAYANLQRATISIMPTISGRAVFFKAFITTFNETYNSNWESESVFGRTDPIYMFKQTTRSITLAFKVPSVGSGEAYQNLGRIQNLIHCLYPAYTNLGNASTIAQSPLCRIGVLNLTPAATMSRTAQNSAGRQQYGHPGRSMLAGGGSGVLCAIKSVGLAHNIENAEGGVYQDGPGSFLPKFIEVTMDFDVIHEKTLGWDRSDEGMRFSNPHGPYLVDAEASLDQGRARSIDAQQRRRAITSRDALRATRRSDTQRAQISLAGPSLYSQESERAQAARAEAENDALRANAEARYGGLFGGLIARRDEKSLSSDRLSTLQDKAARLEESAADHAGTRRGDRLSYRTENAMRAAEDEVQRREWVESLQEFID